MAGKKVGTGNASEDAVKSAAALNKVAELLETKRGAFEQGMKSLTGQAAFDAARKGNSAGSDIANLRRVAERLSSGYYG